MGFRLGFGGGCAPCCGGTAPPPTDPPCLVACRPAGETRPISALNVTMSAKDYVLTADYSEGGTVKQFRYHFDGAKHSGTFALTPKAGDAGVYRYDFPDGCTFYEYDANNCVIRATIYGGISLGGGAEVMAHVGGGFPELGQANWTPCTTTAASASIHRTDRVALTGAAWDSGYNTLAAALSGHFQFPSTYAYSIVTLTCAGVKTHALGPDVNRFGILGSVVAPTYGTLKATAFTVTYGP